MVQTVVSGGDGEGTSMAVGAQRKRLGADRAASDEPDCPSDAPPVRNEGSLAVMLPVRVRRWLIPVECNCDAFGLRLTKIFIVGFTLQF